MTDDKDVTQYEHSCPCNATSILPKRYMVAMLSFFGFANVYAMRVNLSIAVAVMVSNHTVIKDGKEVQVSCHFQQRCTACNSGTRGGGGTW